MTHFLIISSHSRARPVYIGGQLVYCVGMVFMAMTRSKWGVLLFSWSAGVMYSTLFTMPYLLVAHYHETDATVIISRNFTNTERTVENDRYISLSVQQRSQQGKQERG